MMLVIEDTPAENNSDYDDSDSDGQSTDSGSEDSDGPDCPTPAVICIALQAAVLMIDKYLDFL